MNRIVSSLATNPRSLVGFQLVQVPPSEELQKAVLLNHFPKQFKVKTATLWNAPEGWHCCLDSLLWMDES